MGPRFFKRGDVHGLMRLIVDDLASMGPRFFKRGDSRRPPPRQRRNELQWGHASLSVETPDRAADVAENVPLQWGHASLSVETFD